MKKTVIKHEASDRKMGMTVAELETFLQAVTDHDTPASGVRSWLVKIRTTWRGTIRSAQVTIEHDEN